MHKKQPSDSVIRSAAELAVANVLAEGAEQIWWMHDTGSLWNEEPPDRPAERICIVNSTDVEENVRVIRAALGLGPGAP